MGAVTIDASEYRRLMRAANKADLIIGAALTDATLGIGGLMLDDSALRDAIRLLYPKEWSARENQLRKEG